jgi:ParB-like chromosome segregation protein Spo0J
MEASPGRWQREAVDLELHQLAQRHADLRIHDDGRRRRLLASLAERGQQVPVVVVTGGEQQHVLIDGYLRAWALARLGRDTVTATVWPLSEADALLEHHHLSSASRTAIEEAWLCARLREQGLSLDQLAQRLCRSKSWVSRRLALLGELGASAQAAVRAGTIPPHAAMKCLVPLARANRRACEQLVEALGQTRVSVRDVAALYTGWRRADPMGRQRIVSEPALYLRAFHAAELEPAADDDASTALVKDLSTLSAVAWRARKHVTRGTLAVDASYGRFDLTGAWRAADTAFDALRAALKEAWPDAGSDHPSDHPETA